MNLGEILRRVRSLVSVDDYNLVTRQQMIDFINDAQMDIASVTECLRGVETTTVSEGVRDYSFDADFLRVTKVVFDDKTLGQATIAGLDALDEDWRDDEGTPTKYFMDESLTWLSLYPKPDSDADGKTLELHVIYKPAILSDDTDTPEIPTQYHSVIVDYVISQLKKIAGDYNAAVINYRFYQGGRDKVKRLVAKQESKPMRFRPSVKYYPQQRYE